MMQSVGELSLFSASSKIVSTDAAGLSDERPTEANCSCDGVFRRSRAQQKRRRSNEMMMMMMRVGGVGSVVVESLDEMEIRCEMGKKG